MKKILYLKNLLTRVLLSIIFVLGSMIYINYSDGCQKSYEKYVFTESLAFNKFNSFYKKYMGDLTNSKVSTEAVFSEKIAYRGISSFKDGYSLDVGFNYLVPNINSGVVVFNGDKEGYGNTLIIQGVDGVDIWYCNILVYGIELYDYIETGSLLGETESDSLILVVNKDGEYLNYEEYINEI